MAKKPKTVLTPFPMPRLPKLIGSTARLREYEEAAKTLGFNPVALQCAQMLDFFAEQQIQLRDYKQVDSWMSVKAKRDGATHWCWRPLRPKDIITEYSWGQDKSWRWSDGFYCRPNMGDWARDAVHACRPYEKLVPKKALEAVAKIEGKFGDGVKFFVSDYAVIVPDPFIMVRPARRGDGPVSRQNFVFGVWMEPGFGK